MTTPAENIIQKMFNSAEEDERVAPVVSPLREAYAHGRWNPGALAEVVETATRKKTEASS